MKPKGRHTLREVVLRLSGLCLMLFLGGFFVTSNRPGEPSLSGDLLRSMGIDPRLLILLLVVGIIIAAFLRKH
jgi:hypothetical protein